MIFLGIGFYLPFGLWAERDFWGCWYICITIKSKPFSPSPIQITPPGKKNDTSLITSRQQKKI